MAALVLVHSGCGTADGPEPLPACPPASILAGADRISARDNAQTTTASIRYAAALRELSSTCAFEADGIDMDLRLELVAEPGPAFAGEPIEVVYFIAVVDERDQILGKQLLRTSLVVPPDRAAAASAEEISLRLPGPEPGDGRDLRLLVGFQLDQPAPTAPPADPAALLLQSRPDASAPPAAGPLQGESAAQE